MHKLKLNINGQTKCMPIELTPEQEQQVELFIAAAQNTEVNYTGWEKPEIGEYAYFEDENGTVASAIYDEKNREKIDDLYDNVKCFSHPAIATHAIRVQVLLRKLRRFAAIHRTAKYDTKVGGYTIMYNYIDGCLEIGATGAYLALGDIIFETEELAWEAINTFGSELTWYFTHTTERLWPVVNNK